MGGGKSNRRRKKKSTESKYFPGIQATSIDGGAHGLRLNVKSFNNGSSL